MQNSYGTASKVQSLFLLAWRNCKREEKRSLAAEIFDQLQIKDKLSIQNCDKGIGEKVATAGWKANFALKETLIICDLSIFRLFELCIFLVGGGGSSRLHIGTEPKCFDKYDL